MAENFFKSLFKGNLTDAPEEVNMAFCKKFPDAINIEWVTVEECYESVFYEHETEKIARFSKHGGWLETLTNIDVTVLEEKVRKSAEQYGEIMSSIEIQTPGSKKFEIIIRDKQLKRFLLILSSEGLVFSNNIIN